MRAETMADECPLTEQEQAWLDGGISEFNTGRYWHAHEDWEEMWKSLKAREADGRYILGIQGLIQTTALMFQYELQKRRGTIPAKLMASLLKVSGKAPSASSARLAVRRALAHVRGRRAPLCGEGGGRCARETQPVRLIAAGISPAHAGCGRRRGPSVDDGSAPHADARLF